MFEKKVFLDSALILLKPTKEQPNMWIVFFAIAVFGLVIGSYIYGYYQTRDTYVRKHRDLTEAEKLAIREMVGKATSCFNIIYQQDIQKQHKQVKEGSYQFGSLPFMIYEGMEIQAKDRLAKMITERDNTHKEIFAEFLKQYQQRAVTHS